MKVDYTPNVCEHQRIWETKSAYGATTDGSDKPVIYRSYSCVLIGCPHRDRECEVKRQHERDRRIRDLI